MAQSAQWVAVTLNAIAASGDTSEHDGLDLRQAADFIRNHEGEFNEQAVVLSEEAREVSDEAAGEE